MGARHVRLLSLVCSVVLIALQQGEPQTCTMTTGHQVHAQPAIHQDPHMRFHKLCLYNKLLPRTSLAMADLPCSSSA